MAQFNRLMDGGRAYPRWMGDSFAGLGLPVFYFYPPLAYYLGWLIHSITPASDPNTLYNIAAFTMLLASIGTSYCYFRRFASLKRQRYIASLLYAVLPYRFFQLFLRDAFSEELAFVFLPLLFLAVDHLFERHPESKAKSGEVLSWTVAFALITAAIVYTNLPVVAMILLSLPVYFIVRCINAQGVPKLTVYATLGAMLGLLLSSAYLLPLFHFRKFIHTDFLYSPSIGFLYSLYDIVAVNRSNLFFVPAMMTLIGFVAMILMIVKRTEISPGVKPWVVIGALVAFLQTPWVSYPVWKYLPLINLTQTSSRWSILLCLSVPIVYLSIKGWRRSVFLFAVAALLCTSYIHSYSSVQIAFASPRENTTMPAQRDAPEYFPLTMGNDAWRVWNLAHDSLTSEIQVIGGDAARISEIHRTTDRTTFTVNAATSTNLRFRRWYWPAWKLRVPGRGIAITYDSIGLITASMPAGNYEANLVISRSSTEKFGSALSLAGLIILIAISIVRFALLPWRRKQSQNQRTIADSSTSKTER